MTARNIAFLDDAQWPQDCFDFELPMEPESTALLVIDMQNYCVSAEGHLGHGLRQHDPELFEFYSQSVNAVTEQIGVLLAVFRDLGHRVIYTRHGSLLEDGGDLVERRRSREDLALDATGGQSGHMASVGSVGHQIISELEPHPGDLILDKNTSSVFNSTEIDLFLRNMGIKSLVVTGLVTDQCVLMSALDAADRGFHVVIGEDACATVDPGSQEATLLLFRRVWGYAQPAAAIIDWLQGRRPDLR